MRGKQMMNEATMTGFSVNSENECLDSQTGARARAINPLADALQTAGLGGPLALARPLAQGMHAMSISAALASLEQPQGELLTACQVQRDAQLVERCIAKLVGKMAGAGRVVERPNIAVVTVDGKARRRETGGHDWRDARAAGMLALTVWRHTGNGADGLPEVNAARVAWRAVVNALSRDAYGESTDSVDTIERWADDKLPLWANEAMHTTDRRERALARLTAMQATTRKVRLGKRMAAMPAGRGNRAATIEKVAKAAESLLDGANLDKAATLSGFNACERSRHSAADGLIQACRRLGIVAKTGNGGQQFTARMSKKEDGERRAPFVPMLNPSRTLGGQFGVSWDTGLVAVSDIDGCIEWTLPTFSNAAGHADEVLRELAKQHAATDDISEQVESPIVAPFMPTQWSAANAATAGETFIPSPTAGTVTVYGKSNRETRDGVIYVSRSSAQVVN